MVAMSVEPHTRAAANSANSMDGSMSTLMSSSRTPPMPAYALDESTPQRAKKKRASARLYMMVMASPKTGMGLCAVKSGRPIASIKATAKNSGGIMRSAKLASSLWDSGRAKSLARSR